MLSACAGHTTLSFDGQKPDVRTSVIAVAQPVFLQDIQVPDEGEEVWSGSYVGNLLFSGGFHVVAREGGLENVSLNIELSQQERYRSQIQEVVSQCVFGNMGREGREWVPVELDDQPPIPTRRNIRGTEKTDGRDNQPLPRFSLSAPAWEAGAPVPNGADALLVPYVVHYYGHNGGWFLGQTYGSAGGARVRVFWSLYGADGGVIGWGDHEARTEHHGNFSPNSQQIQDFLIDVEEGVCKTLKRKLP
ncbi:MAG: hypothetical protein ACJAZO_005218 [Myxococcota bacterium]